MQMVDSKQDISFPKLDFPSDCLNVKQLREIYPDRIDRRMPEDADAAKSLYDDLATLLLSERNLAAFTYEQARETFRSDGLYAEDLKFLRKELASDYISFGLANGKAQAEELVRSIERQALDQARQHGIPGRG